MRAAALGECGGGASLESVSPWTPISASTSSSGLAVCSCLSPAPCYKVCVICSVKCRPQTEGQLKVRQQRHPVPPGPAAHRKQGLRRVPLVWLWSQPVAPATQALMQGDTRPNDSLISLKDSDDPTGPWESDRGFVQSDLFCLVPPVSLSSSFTQVLVLCSHRCQAMKLGIWETRS